MNSGEIIIVGGGLAGCEAAARAVRAGGRVVLYEMKPNRFSPAHHMPELAELVCSNSLRSNELHSAVGLLKEEMRRLGSLVMEAAEATQVPAGKALAVDRVQFARYVTERVEALPGLTVVREEFTEIDPGRLTVLAAGPLASEALAGGLAGLIGSDHLYFYDAIAPIVASESVDMNKAFMASRYDETGVGDYLNCPMSEDEYHAFVSALLEADRTTPRPFEDFRFFEGCLPIEVMAERGPLTLAFGPMKPVGLVDPHTGRQPFAVVQLRKENAAGTTYNLVGFQTRLRRPKQDRVFRLIPGLERAEFERWGGIHRNTFINAPAHLNRFLQLAKYPNIILAGQLSGVEGYVESAAAGILAGENAARLAAGREPVSPPPTTALGGLVGHLTNAGSSAFQPSNVNFGMLPPPTVRMKKKLRPEFYATRALDDLSAWMNEVSYER